MVEQLIRNQQVARSIRVRGTNSYTHDMPDTYAIREVTEHHIPGFAVVHPETGKLVSNRSFPNGYCEQPITAIWNL